MSNISNSTSSLVDLQPQHPFFIGIDSDGCAFDTMEIKQKECFCPNTVNIWGLQAVSKYAREAVEFVNLYSRWRGINRWPALVMVFDLLRERPEVMARGTKIPEAKKIREFMESGFALSNDGLKDYMAEHPDPELEQAWTWTTAVNKTIAEIVHGVPPFPFVHQSLEAMQDKVDIVVVSATPNKALFNEWAEHDIAKYVRVIAGQEYGNKKQILSQCTKGKYPSDHILMIGDAPGDMDTARANNALFYPINPGHEEASWERFYKEGLEKFISGSFEGEHEASLIREFDRLLPEVPPWKK